MTVVSDYLTTVFFVKSPIRTHLQRVQTCRCKTFIRHSGKALLKKTPADAASLKLRKKIERIHARIIPVILEIRHSEIYKADHTAVRLLSNQQVISRI